MRRIPDHNESRWLWPEPYGRKLHDYSLNAVGVE